MGFGGMMTEKKNICYLDGNSLCVVKPDFVNLQESDAFFVELTEEQRKKYKEFDGEEQ